VLVGQKIVTSRWCFVLVVDQMKSTMKWRSERQ
jgi:hypothetical protein